MPNNKEYLQEVARAEEDVRQLRASGRGYKWPPENTWTIPVPPEVLAALKAATQKQKALNADPNSTPAQHIRCLTENLAANDQYYKAVDEWKAKNPRETTKSALSPTEPAMKGEEAVNGEERRKPLSEQWMLEEDSKYFSPEEWKMWKTRFDAGEESLRKFMADKEKMVNPLRWPSKLKK